MNDRPVTQRRQAAENVEAFRIDDPLPERIDREALRSGNYPYDKRMKQKHYARELYRLQLEFLKLVDTIVARGERVAILFEGRDAAGKGGAIARIRQHLNPRLARDVALPKPTAREEGQWYFQRYAEQLPAKGELVIFDRSWYNRAVVEPVFGFATPEQVELFLREVPRFESMLVEDGIVLIKIFLSIGREMQMKRLHARHHDPLKRWKLSALDYRALDKWDAFSDAIDRMVERTDTTPAPWTMVLANDKRRTRLEVIRSILSRFDYDGKDRHAIGEIDRKIILSGASFRELG
jgi:polyphosphate kinase 2